MRFALDPCCGNGLWLKNRQYAGMIIKGDCITTSAVDFLADTTILPFADSVFDDIFCDPPHHLRNPNWNGKWNIRYMQYGHFINRDAWLVFLKAVSSEFRRVIKIGGTLHFKCIDGKDRRVTKLSEVTDAFALPYWRLTKSEGRKSRFPWSTCTTYFLEFRLTRK